MPFYNTISPQYFAIPHNALQYSPTESFHIVFPQRPLHNNTFIHLVPSNNTNYIHQFYASDQWLNYAASTNSHKQLLRVLGCFFYFLSICSSQNHTSTIPSLIRSDLMKYLSQLFKLTVSNRQRDKSLPAQRSHTHTLLSRAPCRQSTCSLTHSV